MEGFGWVWRDVVDGSVLLDGDILYAFFFQEPSERFKVRFRKIGRIDGDARFVMVVERENVQTF